MEEKEPVKDRIHVSIKVRDEAKKQALQQEKKVGRVVLEAANYEAKRLLKAGLLSKLGQGFTIDLLKETPPKQDRRIVRSVELWKYVYGIDSSLSDVEDELMTLSGQGLCRGVSRLTLLNTLAERGLKQDWTSGVNAA